MTATVTSTEIATDDEIAALICELGFPPAPPVDPDGVVEYVGPSTRLYHERTVRRLLGRIARDQEDHRLELEDRRHTADNAIDQLEGVIDYMNKFLAFKEGKK